MRSSRPRSSFNLGTDNNNNNCKKRREWKKVLVVIDEGVLADSSLPRFFCTRAIFSWGSCSSALGASLKYYSRRLRELCADGRCGFAPFKIPPVCPIQKLSTVKRGKRKKERMNDREKRTTQGWEKNKTGSSFARASVVKDGQWSVHTLFKDVQGLSPLLSHAPVRSGTNSFSKWNFLWFHTHTKEKKTRAEGKRPPQQLCNLLDFFFFEMYFFFSFSWEMFGPAGHDLCCCERRKINLLPHSNANAFFSFNFHMRRGSTQSS